MLRELRDGWAPKVYCDGDGNIMRVIVGGRPVTGWRLRVALTAAYTLYFLFIPIMFIALTAVLIAGFAVEAVRNLRERYFNDATDRTDIQPAAASEPSPPASIQELTG